VKHDLPHSSEHMEEQKHTWNQFHHHRHHHPRPATVLVKSPVESSETPREIFGSFWGTSSETPAENFGKFCWYQPHDNLWHLYLSDYGFWIWMTTYRYAPHSWGLHSGGLHSGGVHCWVFTFGLFDRLHTQSPTPLAHSHMDSLFLDPCMDIANAVTLKHQQPGWMQH
jgi:hypothetical protein